MTDHDPDQDDVLKELDAALQVEPSRAFADGVRARVTQSRARTTQMWWGLAAAASVTLAAVVLWRPATYAPANDAPVKVAVAPPQATVPAVPSKAPESVVAMAPVATPAVARRRATATRAAVAAIASEPRLEVITNQGAVLRQLWADYRGRTLVVADAGPIVDGLAPKPITVGDIVVAPIVVVEMGKEPVPAGATPIIRRANATKETR